MSTILQLVNADRSFSSFVKGLKATELEETLNGRGPFTMLVPINLAFSNLTGPALEELMKPGNAEKLYDLLSCQILAERKLYRDFTNGQKVKTISGKEMNVTVKDGEVRINGAKILAHDRQGSNGIVHSVDAVSISL